MTKPGRYRDAGVDLDAADTALDAIREAVASTYTPRVVRGLGAFGGLFRADALPERPVLVATTDGVGTKTRVAAALGRWRGIGRDLVNHCVDDVLVQGGRPLFFLDYVASSRLDPALVADLVAGMADACRAAGAALLGGETAEMPGVYAEREVDVVGTLVGVVDEARLLDGGAIEAGDVVLGLASHGLQTNGFSLARHVLEGRYEAPLGDGRTIGEHLLDAHRSFLPAVAPLLDAGLVRGAAHVTGGGIGGNLPRVLPGGLGAVLDGRWPEPEIFGAIRDLGGVAEEEMRRVFNLGVGFLLVVREEDVARADALSPEPLLRVGRVVPGEGVAWDRPGATP
jgi:phosphoribosylformylglycinamidine cyclo-ligase